MDALRTNLLQSTGNPERFANYRLVEICKDKVSGGQRIFHQGQLTLADPDTYQVAGQDHRAVYSVPLKGHMMLPDTDVREAIK